MKPNRWKTQYFQILFVLFLFNVFICCTSEEDRKTKHLERARQYIEINELRSAAIELKNVVQLDPENDDAYYDLGGIYMKLKQEKEAIQFFAHAVSINPDNLKAQLKMGQIFLLGKETKEARRIAKLILKSSPDNIEALNLLSGVQIQERNLNSALKTLEKAASIDPTHFKTQMFLAHLFLLKGEFERAEKAYLNALSIDSSSHLPYLELTRLYSTEGQWDKAESVLKQMAKTPGQKYQKILFLAQFYESQKRWDLAEKTYLEAVESGSGNNVVPLMNLSSYYARRNSYDKSLVAMQTALQIKKDDLTILASIGQLHLNFNRIIEAEVVVDNVLEKNKEHVLANYIKGRLYFLKHDFVNAFEHFNLVIEKAPRNAMAYYYRALCTIEKGGRNLPGQDLFKAAAGLYDDTESWERRQAKEDLIKALDMNPKLVDARLILAEFYLRDRDRELASQQIEIVLDLAPDNLNALILLGSLKIQEGDAKGAEAVCKRVLKLDPNNATWHVRLGIVYNLMERQTDALKSFKKALELNPIQIDALELVVSIYARDKEFNEALEICGEYKQKAAGNKTSVAYIEYLEGKIFLAKKDTKKAQQHFKKAIENDPDILAPYELLARIYEREKKISIALSMYETILNKNPKHLSACMALGTHYDRQGEKEKAEIYYRKALAIKGDYAPAANNLAFILVERGEKIDEAFDLAKLARGKRPKDPNVMDTLGWIYYLKGSYDNAIAELQKSLKRNPDNALANYHLGRVYYEKREFKKAREFMKKALNIDPNFRGANDARTFLDE